MFNRSISLVKEDGRDVLRIDEQPGEGLAWLPGREVADGVIEFDARGKNVPQKSFVGVAFHGVDESTYDAVYFRPFNFKTVDPVRQVHSVQYISPPDYGWKRLREEHPGIYEAAVQPVPDPDHWFHARVVLAYPSDIITGWIGFWVGDSSGGDYANLKITSSK